MACIRHRSDMKYICIKDYPEHNMKINDEVGMNKEFAAKLIKEKIIKVDDRKVENGTNI
jgi:hypothetical protein